MSLFELESTFVIHNGAWMLEFDFFVSENNGVYLLLAILKDLTLVVRLFPLNC